MSVESIRQKLTAQAADALPVFSQMPLASIDDIVQVTRFPRSRVYSAFQTLKEFQLAIPAHLGWTREKVARWHIPDDALDIVDELLGPGHHPCSRWHEAWGRSLLLPRIPALESGYTVVAETRDMGPVSEILWLSSSSLDLAVRYENGWAAIIWSGAMQRESSLLSRLHDFGSDMVELSSSPEPAWPGLITIIAGDEWQRELVAWVVESFGDHLRDRVSVWCVTDGARTGAVRSLDSRGWIRQNAYPRDMGGWSWEERLASSPWSKSGSVADGPDTAFRWHREGSALTTGVLDFLVQRKDVPIEMIQQALGEGASGRAVYRRVNKMCREELVERSQLPRERAYRYSLSSKGRQILTARDRLPSPKAKSKNNVGRSRSRRSGRQRHEDLVSGFMAMHMGVGIPAATGERHWEHLGDGGIAPDVLVFLVNTPFGPVWCYVEVELSARGESRWRKKLAGYGNPRRRDDFPVLAICRDKPSETNAQTVGRELGITRLITTTVDRLAKNGPLGNDAAWSRYGQAVTLNGPGPSG